MTWEKDIRFPEKKVDSDWKSALPLKVEPSNAGAKSSDPHPASNHPKNESKAGQHPTSKDFLNLISSLGYQALMQLGEIPDPNGQLAEANLDGAREVINLLMAIKQKTEGNLSSQESEMLTALLAELQMKYAGHS